MVQTRLQKDNTQGRAMKQTTLSASPLDGSVMIVDSPEETAAQTPVKNLKFPGTPGRAVRCTGKTSLFPPPPPNVSVETVIETIMEELLCKVDDEISRQPVQQESELVTPPTQDRDLQDILRDALAPSPSPSAAPTDAPSADAPSADAPNLLQFYKDRCLQLQRDVIATEIKCKELTDHAASLEAMVKILNEDLGEKLKDRATSLKETKRLQGMLDQSRLNCSKATGIRHHLDSKDKSGPPPPASGNLPKGTTGGKKSPTTSTSTMDDALKAIQTELAANRAQMRELQNQVSSALHGSDSQSEFTTVRSRKAKKNGSNPPPGASRPPPSYSDVAAGRIPKPDTITFGSSMARGTGNALRNHGVRAIEYNFPGYDLEQLTAKIVPILEKNPQVTKVILNTGGNDCEYEGVPLQDIKAKYDALIDTIKLQQGWECEVIISSVPQRRQATHETRHKIAGLNLEHYYHSDPDKHVHYVDSAPKVASFFYDRVHLNHHGLDYWARKVSSYLSSNFHGAASTSRM